MKKRRCWKTSCWPAFVLLQSFYSWGKCKQKLKINKDSTANSSQGTYSEGTYPQTVPRRVPEEFGLIRLNYCAASVCFIQTTEWIKGMNPRIIVLFFLVIKSAVLSVIQISNCTTILTIHYYYQCSNAAWLLFKSWAKSCAEQWICLDVMIISEICIDQCCFSLV